MNEEGNLKRWYYYLDDDRGSIKGGGLPFPEFLLVKYGKVQKKELIWDNRYEEWCNKISSPNTPTLKLASDQENYKPRPKDYPFKDWLLTKVGHTEVSEPVKKALLKTWLLDCFQEELVKDPRSRNDIWENFKKVQRDNTYWWHDQKSEEEERQELGINIEEYDPPMVHVETFERKRYSFDSGQNFIFVTKELMDALPLGRENGSRFRDMIRKDVDSGRRIHRNTLYQGSGIRGLLDSFLCGIKVLSWRKPLGYAIKTHGYRKYPKQCSCKTITSEASAVTAEEKIQKKNDLKARSILMMTLPSEHLLTFNQYKDAKTFFEAIEARFDGNEAIKKTEKTLMNQLAILGENISQEDLNFKFLRSLPSEWSMHVVVWRNKPDLGSISFDDLYNNFKIVEQEVKRSVISSSNSNSQNVAFVSTPSSTNDVNTSNVLVNTASSSLSTASSTDNTARLSDATIYAFLANQPNGSQVVHEDLEQIHEDDLEEMDLKWQLALLSMKARKFYQRTGKKIIINGSDTAGYDKTKIQSLCGRKLVFYKKNEGMLYDQIVVLKRDASFNESEINALKIQIERLKKEKESNQIKIDNFENASKSLDKLIGSQISENNRKGVGYNVVAPPPTGLFSPPTIDLSNSGLEEFKQPEFKEYGVKVNKSVSENSYNVIKKTFGAPIIEDWVSDCDEDETLEKVSESANVQKPKQADQPRKSKSMKDLEEMDLKWQLALLSMKEESSIKEMKEDYHHMENLRSKSMLALDGAGDELELNMTEE
ncbi:hypothetical protein Tco_1311523 [Tanacetum coccineum]